MLISKIFECSKCKGKAHEYHGLEGGIYISSPTQYDCPNAADKEHDFVCIKEVAKEDQPMTPQQKKNARRQLIARIMVVLKIKEKATETQLELCESLIRAHDEAMAFESSSPSDPKHGW